VPADIHSKTVTDQPSGVVAPRQLVKQVFRRRGHK